MARTLSITELAAVLLRPCFVDVVTNKVVEVPVLSRTVDEAARIRVTSSTDLAAIPTGPGAYWILTDEPVRHCLNSGKSLWSHGDGLAVVYNGGSCNLRQRARQHLLRKDHESRPGSQSGISVDLLTDESLLASKTVSHLKYAWTPDARKLPKIVQRDSVRKVQSRDDLKDLYLTSTEREYLDTHDRVFFKNGIDVGDPKHRDWTWIFAYVPIPSHTLREYVEQTWRKVHGTPVLCTYTEGR
ncbi:hypothetical protein GGF32_006386 [Allomyces javanicus]|nr:hypothetical protein GGF32_006386 [Allomyces javanicus]